MLTLELGDRGPDVKEDWAWYPHPAQYAHHDISGGLDFFFPYWEFQNPN